MGMTMEETKVKIEVMQHFLDGGEIEWMYKDGPVADDWTTWAEDYEPLWDWVAFDYRIKKTPKFRLPTKEEFDNLIDNFSRWDREKKGIEILNKKGDILFFPAAGFCSGTSAYSVGSHGYYWSSTIDEDDSYYAYNFYFDSNYKDVSPDDRTYRQSIRLVSDTPFEGGIEFGGVYWKTENEPGYYSWKEAMSKFNKE